MSDGETDDAGDVLRLARDLRDNRALDSALDEFANMQLGTNDPAGAVATYEELLALRIKQFGPNHVNVAAVHESVSRAYRRISDLGACARRRGSEREGVGEGQQPACFVARSAKPSHAVGAAPARKLGAGREVVAQARARTAEHFVTRSRRCHVAVRRQTAFLDAE